MRPVCPVSSEAFDTAARELEAWDDSGTELCAPFLRVLPVDGAAISTLGAPFGTETISASDAFAARIDELQFDLGEGPCWRALATRRPVLSPDVRLEQNAAWPMFRAALGETDVGGLFAFPLAIGTLEIGAVDLYSFVAGPLPPDAVADATRLADIVARVVLRRALRGYGSAENDSEWTAVDGPDPAAPTKPEGEGFSRRVIHQATGMILAQLDLSAADALLLLRGYAFSNARSVRSVAHDVVARKFDFSTVLSP
ncbi:GAF domain-containing protein [Cryobacterium sp. RTS3]|uniref:GAF domain-containing protein n=1 Tax=Cryobacterium sp. RTS3 TaxID=3048643 RepID=UPI002B2393B8|nr:GAF domain-containing protein [Cryobacterium sp. RTS3]MEA9998498.1 GAF domain-containing protein [Cryobacterium sp. RTS3]